MSERMSWEGYPVATTIEDEAMSALADSTRRYNTAIEHAATAGGWDVLAWWDSAIASATSARRQARTAGYKVLSLMWLDTIRSARASRASAADAWRVERNEQMGG